MGGIVLPSDGNHLGEKDRPRCAVRTPKRGNQATAHTSQMWLIYACIAMVTPIALLLARRWLRSWSAGMSQPGGGANNR